MEKSIGVGWTDIGGKRVSLGVPSKRGKYYLTIIDERLDDEADWMDFAEKVIEYIHFDLSKSDVFNHFKSKLNV